MTDARREEIARIIDPDAIREFEFASKHGWQSAKNGYKSRVEAALKKADAILALSPAMVPNNARLPLQQT